MPSGSENVAETLTLEGSLGAAVFANLSESFTYVDSSLPVTAFALTDTANAVAQLLSSVALLTSEAATISDAQNTAYSANLSEAGNIVTQLVAGFRLEYSESVALTAPQIVALAQRLAEIAQAADSVFQVTAVNFADNVDFLDTQIVAKSLELSETTNVFEQLAKDLFLASELTDIVETIDSFGKSVALVIELQNTINLSDSSPIQDALNIIDFLVASGQSQTFYSAAVTVLSAMLASSSGVPATGLTTTESLQVGDSSAEAVLFLSNLLEALTIADTYENALVIAVQDIGQIEIADTQELNAQLFSLLLDDVDVHTLFKSPSELTQGVAMNLEGAKPISEYSNFNYNSLTYFKGGFYGASDSGIYELSGDEDDGTAITARLQSLMLDFGTSRQKRVRSAYLGYTSSGELVLRVTSVSQGQLTEDWYAARKKGAVAAPQENITHVGQGLKSRYWQFELTNVDGADFEIDLLEMHPIFLGRRV